MSTAIWWVRRDLRLADNQALHAALAANEQVVPLFILDPALLASPFNGSKRTAFMLAGLRALDADLRSRGSRLLVRSGNPVAVIAQVSAETGASAIFAERNYSPYAERRDTLSAGRLRVPLHLMGGMTARAPESIHKEDGQPYVVYAPFARRWRSLPPLAAGDILPAPEAIRTPAEPHGEPIPLAPEMAPGVLFAAGETAARQQLDAFVAGAGAPIFDYAALRSQPGAVATSRLSPYLRWGMLSPREAVAAAYAALERADAMAGSDTGSDAGVDAERARQSVEKWLAEVIWREYYISILHHFPQVRRGAYRPQYDTIAWRNDEADFAAWCEGRTGYPIVDAAMRQMRAEGWMHNRCRLITASFLVKDLLIDWRWGERYFMQHLIDGDPASNNGNWQWVAGSGADPAPPFRVLNPVLQSQRFDPDGVYIRRWLPELRDVPTKFLHGPWEMNAHDQREARCRLGVDYPLPIVDHRVAREQVREAYRGSQRVARE